jgi:hypothetical protein
LIGGLYNLRRRINNIDIAGSPRSRFCNQEHFTADHADTAGILNNLARLFQVTGEFGRARPLLERSLAINEKALGRGLSLAGQTYNGWFIGSGFEYA